MAQITYVASSINTTAGGTSVTRASVINGQDVICLMHVHYDDTAATSNLASSGFTQDSTANGGGGSFEPTVIRFAVKIAPGTAGSQTSDPSSYTITNSGGNYQVLAVWAMRNEDTTTPVQATSTTATGTGTAMSVSGITVARDLSTALWMKAGYSSATSADPSTFTSIVSDLDGVCDVFRKDVTTGATGTITAAQASSSFWANILAIIQPPAAAGATSGPPDGGAHVRNVRSNPVYRMHGRVLDQPSAPAGFVQRDGIYVPSNLAA